MKKKLQQFLNDDELTQHIRLGYSISWWRMGLTTACAGYGAIVMIYPLFKGRVLSEETLLWSTPIAIVIGLVQGFIVKRKNQRKEKNQ